MALPGPTPAGTGQQGMRAEGCPIDNHPQADKIAQWMKADLSSTTINANLAKIGAEKVKHQDISTHRRFCIGLPPARRGRPVKVPDEEPDEIDWSDVDDETLLGDLRKLLRHRVKNNPASLKTSEIISYINAQTRLREAREKGKQKGDPLDAAMAGLDELAIAQDM